jgi:hypothetical protein
MQGTLVKWVGHENVLAQRPALPPGHGHDNPSDRFHMQAA